jgi:hypothetical protein
MMTKNTASTPTYQAASMGNTGMGMADSKAD